MRCTSCRNEFAVEGREATIIGPLEPLPTTSCPKCGADATPRSFLPDLVLRRRRRIVAEISGEKSSIHDRAKVGFYNMAGVRWVEVTNETTRSPGAVRAICQALAISMGTSKPQAIWAYGEFP